MAVVVAILVSLLNGCGDTPPSTGRGAIRGGGEIASSQRAEMLVGTMETLFKLEENEFGQAEQLVMSRLNQWVRGQEIKVPWQREQRLDALPSRLSSIRGVQSLDDESFLYEHDFAFLREAAWMHRIADNQRAQRRNGGARRSETSNGASAPDDSPLRFVSPDDPEELRLAMRLFDWTVRNVQLEADDWLDVKTYLYELLPTHWHTPYETALLGRGTASDRAWTFILLARQQNLDVVMLGLGNAQQPTELKPWIPALVHASGEGDNKKVDLYLFDPALGLPIPGPDGRGIATLAQAAADDKLLRQLDLDDKRPYSVKAEEIQQVTALVEASPGYLSRRMKFLESRLGGQQRITLTVSPQAIEEKLAGAAHVRPGVVLWMRPFETLRLRQTDDDALLEAARAELFPLQGLLRPIGAMATDRKTTARREETSEWIDPQQKRPTQSRLRVALGVGRMQQLAGNFDHEAGALRFLLQAMATDDDLREITDVLSNDLRSKLPRPNDPASQLQIRQITESRVAEFRRADQAAKLWVGQIKAEQGQYPTAISYFTKWDNDTWRPGINYSLARVYEAQGKPAEAIRVYRADDSPQRTGNLLRARWLEKQSME